MLHSVMTSITTVSLVFAAATAGNAKERSVLVTAAMRRNALRNATKFEWARNRQESARALGERWAKLSDEALWEMVPSQGLPRDIHTNKAVGCPNCGDKILPFGNYPWKHDLLARPWKLTCPGCSEVYPRNDFGAFYVSALDEHGRFHRERGDRSLLFNSEHPDPNDPLHKVYVDDGVGMVDEKGNRHRMIAYYTEWAQWGSVRRAVNDLAMAYTLTDDRRFAHKAAVLLDRVADVYPAMDYGIQAELGLESSRPGCPGRVVDYVWECRHSWNRASAYDRVFDGIQGDEALAAFCSRQAARYKLGEKHSVADVCRHIEQNILIDQLQAVKDIRINGNNGAHHLTALMTAIALDRGAVTTTYLDWLFEPTFPGCGSPRHVPPGGMPLMLVSGLDRDGMGGECGSYGLGWVFRFVEIAEVLADYPAYTNNNLLRDFPKLKQCFLVAPRMLCLDAALPNIGDSGSTGYWGRPGAAQFYARGYRLYRDPAMAATAMRYADGNPRALRQADAIFDADPTALEKEIATAAASVPFTVRCEHLGRYGQAVLQTEKTTQGRALWIHYGKGKGHSHSDCLNIGVYAKNIDMLPDLGYPEYTAAWPKRHAWTAHTISHETLCVNDTRSAYSPGGKINLFGVQPPLRVIDVASKGAYPKLETYRRTVAMVDASEVDSYVFDVFRARGGRNHRLSYHGPAAAATVAGLDLVKQEKGTFAGPEIGFAEFYDGKKGGGYRGSGFMYLYDVARSAETVAAPFTVDWKAEDKRGRILAGTEPHLRLHALTSSSEVALASGDPPLNKRGNPRRLRYVIQSRLGDNVRSQFVNVLEPYDRTPFIRVVRRLEVEHEVDSDAVIAVAVELVNGTVDTLISCEEPARVRVEGGIEFDGQFAMVRRVNGRIKQLRMSRGSRLAVDDLVISGEPAAFTGKVTRIDVSDPNDHRVFLDPPLPPGVDLVGRPIHFVNTVSYDTTFDIKAIADDSISTGGITLVAGFKKPDDYTAGVRYLVNPGDRYVVPCFTGLDQ
ncbi:MAG: hypothetical protein HN742_39520 [Lentisphaerae bacterium]|nr:hypothetical protein [Lentisphaerota bacterium]MBT4816884.1 hypothetical protein [Lentisphaerota bacterium]MBT5612444.1 hypothetical protein [Lentisphaerota bacterium]MBT7057150.1 hypothetical protein [Lentisphaerota bacterium]MBT7848024.1 hypothetical protein [Lentisphaerota bacterium]